MPKSSSFRDRFTFLFFLDIVASVNSEEKFCVDNESAHEYSGF